MKNTIGTRLRQARKDKHLTQSQLAELSNVSTPEIGRIENDRVSATIDTLLSLCTELDIGLDHLLFDYFSPNTQILTPEIQKVVSIMERMGERHSQYIAEIVSIYSSSHLD